jgi:hypothetical protein
VLQLGEISAAKLKSRRIKISSAVKFLGPIFADFEKNFRKVTEPNFLKVRYSHKSLQYWQKQAVSVHL